MNRLAPSRLAGIAAPLAVWALHFVFVYALTGLACARGTAETWLGLRPFVWGLWASTVAAFALIALLGLRAWRAHRHVAGRSDREPDIARRCFATRVATLSALLAAVAVGFTAAPILLLPHCG